MNKNKNERSEGLFLGFLVYAVVAVASTIIMDIIITVLLIFVPVPAMHELAENGSLLFKISYPVLGFIPFFAALVLSYYVCYLISKKFAFKYQGTVKTKFVYLQLIPILVILLVLDLRSLSLNNITPVFWYLAATVGNIFGAVDYTDFIVAVTSDLVETKLIVVDATYMFASWVVIWNALYFTALFFTMYFGRKAGAKKGLDERLKFRNELYSSLGEDEGRHD